MKTTNMKTSVKTLTTTIIMCTTILIAQDTIYTTENKQIKARVNEIGQNEIKYRMFDNQFGPIYIVSKKEVSKIKYENGNEDVFNIQNEYYVETAKPDSYGEKEMYNKGYKDAAKYYTGKKQFKQGIAVGLIPLPFAGIIGGVIIANKPIAPDIKEVPNCSLTSDANYLKGYQKGASPKKEKKVFGGVATGIGIRIVASVSLLFLLATALGGDGH